jgi:uncharacterized RDD family membrane protein YckC
MDDSVLFCPKCGNKQGGDSGGEQKDELSAGASGPGGIKKMRYQSVGIRFVGLIIDTIILFIPFYLIGNAMAKSGGEVTAEGWSLSGGPAFLFFLVMLVLFLGYYTLLEGGVGGSVGKLVCGMKVLSEEGTKCGFRQAFIRNILRVVDGLFFYLVGAILIWQSPKRQRLGDRAAGTVVVKK